MYKFELADAAGVSRQTFYNWTKADQDELQFIHLTHYTENFANFLAYVKKKQYLCSRKGLMMSTYSYISKLSPVLFWDVDREHMDAEQHSAGLIQRVLEHGTLEDWRLTRDYYGMDRIVADCKRLRTLDPMALSFICAMSNTNKEDYRCYQFRQSTQTLWNS